MSKLDTTDMSVWTPITPRSGRGLVHAISLTEPQKTLCGTKFVGWMVALKAVSCNECKGIIHHDTRTKRGKK